MNATLVFRLFCPLFLCVLLAGCGRNDTVQEADFDIPPSLYDRMRVSYNIVRNQQLGMSGELDGEEMIALMAMGNRDAASVANGPRGEMTFVHDGRSDEERRRLWPFDVEAFEAKLEASLVRDEKGLYRKKDDDGELFAFNPTMRAVNAEMEQWAIGQLDAVFKRVTPDQYEKMCGEPPKAGEEILIWAISNDGKEFFSIERREGAWELRSYQYIRWDGKERPLVYVEFHSFPNRKEAVAMLTALHDVRSLNNLAVLYWRHRVFPLQFNPVEIKDMLEVAKKEGVACAKANLAVLKAHLPNVK